MNNIQNNLITLLFMAITLPYLTFAQDATLHEFTFEVNQVYLPLSIEKDQLKEAKTLLDLNPHYEHDWVREYLAVEISAIHKGQLQKVMSKNEQLNQAQKDLMSKADVGTEISINVQYMPENILKHNEAREMGFAFTVNPENEATYVGGMEQLKEYLQEKVMDKIPDNLFQNYALAAVKFTVDEKGEILEPHIFWTTKDESIDELLVETICNMPSWKPASYANGVKVKQDFALMVGDMRSCVVNMLNVRRD